MLFQKRIDRAFDRLSKQAEEKKASREGMDPALEKEEPPIAESLEKGDLFAMIVSALVTIVPLCLLILLLIVGAAWLFFRI